MEKFRDRAFCLVLYPEDITHSLAIDKIKKSYDCAYILHDRDVMEDGVLKKAHYHVVLRFKNAVWNSAVAKDLGIEINYIQPCKNFKNALLYLIHYYDTDKIQYDLEEVYGSLKSRLKEELEKVDKSEGERVNEIINFIYGTTCYLSTAELVSFCCSNGLWSDLRRAPSIIFRLLDEHNALCDK